MLYADKLRQKTKDAKVQEHYEFLDKAILECKYAAARGESNTVVMKMEYYHYQVQKKPFSFFSQQNEEVILGKTAQAVFDWCKKEGLNPQIEDRKFRTLHRKAIVAYW